MNVHPWNRFHGWTDIFATLNILFWQIFKVDMFWQIFKVDFFFPFSRHMFPQNCLLFSRHMFPQNWLLFPGHMFHQNWLLQMLPFFAFKYFVFCGKKLSSTKDAFSLLQWNTICCLIRYFLSFFAPCVSSKLVVFLRHMFPQNWLFLHVICSIKTGWFKCLVFGWFCCETMLSLLTKLANLFC